MKVSSKVIALIVFFALPLFLSMIGCSGKKGANEEKTKTKPVTSSKTLKPYKHEIIFKTVDGEPAPLSNYEGKIVFLNFFATWNKESLKQIDELNRLYNHYSRFKVAVIGVAVDDNVNKVKAFLETHKVDYPVYVKGRMPAGRYGGVGTLPTTIVLLRDGEVFKKFPGWKSYKFLNAELVNMLRHRL